MEENPFNSNLGVKKRATKKWKRSAREMNLKKAQKFLPNPLQRIIHLSGSPRRSPKKSSPSPTGGKNRVESSKVNNP